jgi:hypothetical protein
VDVTAGRPIFVMGCPRSGTTLLQLMLHSHPRIALPSETRFLLTGYHHRRRFGDLTDPARRRALAQWIVGRKETNFSDLGLDGERVIEEIVAGPPTLGSAFGIVFRAYARRFGKPRWGDKRPAYLQNLHVINHLFPNAQIVNIVRDGRDCVASLKEMPWNRMDIYRSMWVWTRGIDYGRRAERELGPASYHEVGYERLVADPVTELGRLGAFLGEEFDEAMLSPAAAARHVLPQRDSWHPLTHAPVTGARVGSWAERLEPWEVSLCEAVMGSRLRSLGYELTGAPRPSAAHRLRYLAPTARGSLVRPRRALVRQADRLLGLPDVRCRV